MDKDFSSLRTLESSSDDTNPDHTGNRGSPDGTFFDVDHEIDEPVSELDTAFLQPNEEEDANQGPVDQQDQKDQQDRQEEVPTNIMAEAQAYRDAMNSMKHLPNIQCEKFKGKSDKYEVSQWLHKYTIYGNCMNWESGDLAKNIALFLTGDAENWFHQDGTRHAKTWDQIKDDMIKKWRPEGYEQFTERAMDNRKMKNGETFAEYIAAMENFFSLMSTLRKTVSEEDQVRKLMAGLKNRNYKALLSAHDNKTVDEFRRAVTKIVEALEPKELRRVQQDNSRASAVDVAIYTSEDSSSHNQGRGVPCSNYKRWNNNGQNYNSGDVNRIEDHNQDDDSDHQEDEGSWEDNGQNAEDSWNVHGQTVEGSWDYNGQNNEDNGQEREDNGQNREDYGRNGEYCWVNEGQNGNGDWVNEGQNVDGNWDNEGQNGNGNWDSNGRTQDNSWRENGQNWDGSCDRNGQDYDSDGDEQPVQQDTDEGCGWDRNNGGNANRWNKNNYVTKEERIKHIRCFVCDQFGHYASGCPDKYQPITGPLARRQNMVNMLTIPTMPRKVPNLSMFAINVVENFPSTKVSSSTQTDWRIVGKNSGLVCPQNKGQEAAEKWEQACSRAEKLSKMRCTGSNELRSQGSADGRTVQQSSGFLKESPEQDVAMILLKVNGTLTYALADSGAGMTVVKEALLYRLELEDGIDRTHCLVLSGFTGNTVQTMGTIWLNLAWCNKTLRRRAAVVQNMEGYDVVLGWPDMKQFMDIKDGCSMQEKWSSRFKDFQFPPSTCIQSLPLKPPEKEPKVANEAVSQKMDRRSINDEPDECDHCSRGLGRLKRADNRVGGVLTSKEGMSISEEDMSIIWTHRYQQSIAGRAGVAARNELVTNGKASFDGNWKLKLTEDGETCTKFLAFSSNQDTTASRNETIPQSGYISSRRGWTVPAVPMLVPVRVTDESICSASKEGKPVCDGDESRQDILTHLQYMKEQQARQFNDNELRDRRSTCRCVENG